MGQFSSRYSEQSLDSRLILSKGDCQLPIPSSFHSPNPQTTILKKTGEVSLALRVKRVFTDLCSICPHDEGIVEILDTAKATGPDNILAIVLKTCSPELDTPLAKLFQYSYNTGIYPTMWKIAQ
eukprot:g28973.t1